MIDINDINKFTFTSGAYYLDSPYIPGELKLEVKSKYGYWYGVYIFKGINYNVKIGWKIDKKHFYSFLNEIKSIDIFLWNNKYDNTNVCDGGYWSLNIKYNRNKIFEVIGDNDYPNNWDIFSTIMEKYFPIISIDREYRVKLQTNKIFNKANANFT